MADTADILASALEAHQAGQREAAEGLYRQVLAENPADLEGANAVRVKAH